MLAIAIINYRTATETLACIASVCSTVTQAFHIYLLDNGSGEPDVRLLTTHAAAAPNLTFIASPDNLGFAAGMNLLLQTALDNAQVENVLLLNSDTLPTPGAVETMAGALDVSRNVDLVAARLLHPDVGTVESLGITLYKSTLASNRKSSDDLLLGPTGGCALLTRRLLEDIKATYGEWFDETFFCYAEDTDFNLRARWLGYAPAYAADAVVYHSRSLSSGGADSDFVLYHGIRNSLWWLAKDAPTGWLLRSIPWFIALHFGIVVRHLRRGRVRVLWRLYRDAVAGLPKMLKKRQVIAKSRRIPPGEFNRWVTPRFYDPGYLHDAWRDLWRPRQNN